MSKSARVSAGKSPRGKRRNEQHLIDAAGSQLFQSCIPEQWVIHPYRPDYGLDFLVELFKEVVPSPGRGRTYESLGEHLYVQLKSRRATNKKRVRIFGRYNVEKRAEILDRTDCLGTMDIIQQSLDGPLLETVERMGVGVPVLLVTADLSAQACYFICLNDYIDKILVPRFGPGATGRSRSIEIPAANRLSPEGGRDDVLRWYGKRVKLYAAFQRFIFQSGNLREEQDPRKLLALARVFASRVARYDLWDDTGTWEVLAHFGEAVRHFMSTGDATNIRLNPVSDVATKRFEQSRANANTSRVKASDVLRLWDLLATLPGNFEDICREWFLPTAMGYRAGFGSKSPANNLEGKLSILRLT